MIRGNYRNLFKLFALFTEFTLIHFACKLAYFFKYSEVNTYEDYYVSFFIIFNLAWVGASLYNDAYEFSNLTRLGIFLRNLFSTTLIHVFIILLYIVSIKASYLSRYYLFYVYACSLLGIVSFRALLVLAYKYYNALTYHVRRVVIIGPEDAMASLQKRLDSRHIQIFRFLEHVDPNLTASERKALMRKTLPDIEAFCLAEQVEEIYLSLPLVSEDILEELTDFADDNFIYFRVVTDFSALGPKRVNVDFLGHIPVISLRREPLRALANRILKRLFDISFSLGMILFVFPWLFPIIALAIRLDSSGPIFFRQLRTGKRSREFWVYKFRTMRPNAFAETQQATQEDPRITRVGRFLRRNSLDELPQFFNVLRGDMSVVGPRPHMLKHTDEYAKVIDKYLVRHFITPGITGHAQVHGYRGETPDPHLMKKRIEYDTWYLENWSLMLDVKIILQTIHNMLRGQEKAY